MASSEGLEQSTVVKMVVTCMTGYYKPYICTCTIGINTERRLCLAVEIWVCTLHVV